MEIFDSPPGRKLAKFTIGDRGSGSILCHHSEFFGFGRTTLWIENSELIECLAGLYRQELLTDQDLSKFASRVKFFPLGTEPADYSWRRDIGITMSRKDTVVFDHGACREVIMPLPTLAKALARILSDSRPGKVFRFRTTRALLDFTNRLARGWSKEAPQEASALLR
jgi:hypothetical protein